MNKVLDSSFFVTIEILASVVQIYSWISGFPINFGSQNIFIAIINVNIKEVELLVPNFMREVQN